MLKITRITDYALVILCALDNDTNAIYSSVDISKQVGLNIPTVSKILKLLVNNGLVKSYRGSNGGYCLAKSSDKITITEVIECIEGPIKLTKCSLANNLDNICENINKCQLKQPWQQINNVISSALTGISIRDMSNKNIINNI